MLNFNFCDTINSHFNFNEITKEERERESNTAYRHNQSSFDKNILAHNTHILWVVCVCVCLCLCLNKAVIYIAWIE